MHRNYHLMPSGIMLHCDINREKPKVEADLKMMHICWNHSNWIWRNIL